MATTPIKLKRSNTISVIPDTSDLIEGEVALNTVDKKLYVRNDSSTVITLATVSYTHLTLPTTHCV